MYYVNNLDEVWAWLEGYLIGKGTSIDETNRVLKRLKRLGSPYKFPYTTTTTAPLDYTSKPPLFTSTMTIDNDNAYEWQKVPYGTVSSDSFTVNHDGPNPWDFSIKQDLK